MTVCFMQNTQLLDTLGLKEHESAIYLAILEMGCGTVADIAKYTGLHRPTIYAALGELLAKNLVPYTIKGKRKLYPAAHPEKLKKLLDTITFDFDQLLPELVQTYDNRNPRPKMRFFEGEKVTTWVYDDVLATCKKGDIFYRYESPRDYKKNDTHLPPLYFDRVCHKKEIEKFVITNEKTYKNKPAVIERISKPVPAKFDIFEYDITQIVYGNKVAFIDFNTNTAWIIESALFAKFQRQIFKLLFASLK